MSGDEDNCRLDDERMATVNQNLCLDMLKVADGLLSCLEEHREKTGIDLHGRIGVATGVVISGVVGLLQPRFCVFGEGMCLAAELEQTGAKDTVHCSTEFLQFVTGLSWSSLVEEDEGSYRLAYLVCCCVYELTKQKQQCIKGNNPIYLTIGQIQVFTTFY